MRRVKRGDLVMVTAGKERGNTGKVLHVIDGQRVTVEKLNMVKRHTRPSQENPQGGTVEKEAPIHISNIAVVNPNTGKPARIGYRYEASSEATSSPKRSRTKVRYDRETGEVL